ncbi:MAG: hypothetical protein A2Y62_06505 [Candidatus Fischerbacteria bacterium RBG_13_37_8]|uniref:4Fe-4S ferredoxin-type domain-containing protein n=1 Tax=Candidatus Fischerbacteria bacterium RBG_13_37_8 TaxID=1817863 RepID=A0A1F5VDV1_9BACT|nr:MAG: hypothetical protein A2Y62_06505 [Candidatus Fischerbacteria bacterium RBG_13_37_8]
MTVNKKEIPGSGKHAMSRRGFIGTLPVVVGAGILRAQEGTSPEPVAEKKINKIKGFRTLGRTGFKVSDIGLGGVELTTPVLVKAALDHGINYIDTGESYLRGKSEENIGIALKDYDRKSIFISSKLFFKPEATKKELKERTLKCLERLQTDYIDCMMIHGTPTIEMVKSEAFHAAMKELKADGKVRYLGLSNHGGQYDEEFKDMEKIMTAAAEDGRFDVALFVYNFLQHDMGENILKIFKEKNIGATLMKVNPLLEYIELDEYVNELDTKKEEVHEALRKRVALYKRRAEETEAFRKKYNLNGYEQMRDAAIRFALSHPDVHTVTFSIKNFDQIEAYVALSGTTLSSPDKQALILYEKECGDLYCRHACGICEKACPEKVPVNRIMRYRHYFKAQGREKTAMVKYAALKGNKADQCKNCAGYCETACPYGVHVHGMLLHANSILTLE